MSVLHNIQTAEGIFNVGYQSLAVLSLSWAIFRLFRIKSAPLRSAVILVTMAVLFLIPVMNLSSPFFKAANLGPRVPVKIVLSPEKDVSPIPPSFFNTVSPSADLNKTPLSENGKPAASPFRLSPLWIQGINLFGLLWLAGSLFFLMRFFFGVLSLWRLKKTLIPVEFSSREDVLSEATSVFSRPRKIPIYATPHICTPVALGIFKPFILLPGSLLKTMRPSQMRGILIHELSHIYHRDALIGVFQRLITVLNWWNPLAHDLSAALSRAREEISDNCALLRNPSKEYAESLVDLAEGGSFLKRLPVATAMASSHIPLKERVALILSKERNMETRLKKSSLWALVLTAGLCLAFIAGTRTTFAADTSGEQPTAIQERAIVQDVTQEKEEPVRATKDVKPPKLIKKVDAVYPKIAKEAGVQGVVILELTTDIHGRVKAIKVLRSIPLLDQAAVDAVKQWEFEPLILDGKPRPVIFTVTYRFTLDDEEKKDAESKVVEGGIIGGVQGGVSRGVEGGVVGGVQGGVAGGVEGGVVGGVSGGVVGGIEGGVAGVAVDQVIVYGNFAKPKLIKKVDPVYPLDARKAGIKGEVILQVTIDEIGKVIQANVLKSIPALDQAAVDAVRQWVYEPYIVDSEPRSVVFPVIVTFHLK